MAVFSYRARTLQGAIIEGTIEAIEEKAAVERLKEQKYIVIDIKEVEGRFSFAKFLERINPFKPKVGTKDLVVFSRQLSTLVSAGVPIVQGLSILVEQMSNPAFKAVLTKIREDIESGVSITDALRRHPNVFSELYVSMVHAGEVGGILDTILERLSTYLESSEKLRGKVKGALAYPAVVIMIALGVSIFLLTVVIPVFVKMFESFGSQLPLPTQILINISDLVRKYFYLVILIPIASVVAFKRWYATEQGRRYVDSLSLKLPIFGVLLQKTSIARFSQTLSTLVKSGVPILQALDTVAKTSGNRIVEEAVLKARESIREGERISEPLKKSGVFPPMVTQMIAIGEETGNLDAMLSKIAEFYAAEVDAAVSALTSMIEPLLILFLGIVVGGIVVAMYLPMFSVGSLISGAG